jgi:flagellar biosynthesis component FlhA
MIGLFMGMGRIPMMIFAAMAIISAFFGWLTIHDYNLKEQITAEYNQKQEELLREKQAEFQRQMEELQKTNLELLNKSKDKEIVVETQIITIEKEINTKDKKSEAPLYYKELLNKMQKEFGENK